MKTFNKKLDIRPKIPKSVKDIKPKKHIQAKTYLFDEEKRWSNFDLKKCVNRYRDYLLESLITNTEIVCFKKWYLEIYIKTEEFPTPKSCTHVTVMGNVNKFEY